MTTGAAAKKEGDGSPELEGQSGGGTGAEAADAQGGAGSESRNASAGGGAGSGARDIHGGVEVEVPPGGLADLDFVRGLIAAVDESGIDSLDLTLAGTRIKLSKSPRGVQPPAGHAPAYAYGVPMPMPGAFAQPAGAAGGGAVGEPGGPAGAAAVREAEAAAGAEEGATAVAESTTNLIEIDSPMVGTFYRAPAPEAPAYVEVGSRVTKGQTLCILEAMKLMNELTSEVEGVVREILVENAEPVEYGQPLFRIEPA